MTYAYPKYMMMRVSVRILSCILRTKVIIKAPKTSLSVEGSPKMIIIIYLATTQHYSNSECNKHTKSTKNLFPNLIKPSAHSVKENFFFPTMVLLIFFPVHGQILKGQNQLYLYKKRGLNPS